MTPTSSLELISRDELRTLLTGEGSPTTSLFFPTARVVVQPQENSLRLKNLLSRLSDELKHYGMRRHEVDEHLAPLHDLLGDRDFWTTQHEGLAMFRTTAGVTHFRLPFEVEELAVVSDLPYVRPLLPALSPEGYVYVLVLSQSAVRLFKATRHGFEAIDLGGLDVPRSLPDALRYDDFQKPELLAHPPGGAGGRTPAEGRQRGGHGHGDSGEDHKSQLRRYFEALDSGICKILASENPPLIIAAVDYLQSIYRDVSHYGNVLRKGISGNPDRARDDEIHRKALPIIAKERDTEVTALIERFGGLAQRGLGTNDLSDCLRAAHEGRIEVLIVARGAERWGSFDPATGSADAGVQRTPRAMGLVDLAVRQTLLHGGTVRALDAARIPNGSFVVALHRY